MRVRINVTNVIMHVSTLNVVFVPMEDILRGRVSRNADVHSIFVKKPKNKDVHIYMHDSRVG